MNKPLRPLVLRNLGFEPSYHRVAQTNQWNSAMACIASLVKRPIEEVRQVAASQINRPIQGRGALPQNRIADLLAHFGWWIAARYQHANALNELPDLALMLLAAKPDQFALFHRQRFEDGRPPVCYLINPAHGIPADQQFRLDVQAILPCQYRHICLMSEYMKDFW